MRISPNGRGRIAARRRNRSLHDNDRHSRLGGAAAVVRWGHVRKAVQAGLPLSIRYRERRRVSRSLYRRLCAVPCVRRALHVVVPIRLRAHDCRRRRTSVRGERAAEAPISAIGSRFSPACRTDDMAKGRWRSPRLRRWRLSRQQAVQLRRRSFVVAARRPADGSQADLCRALRRITPKPSAKNSTGQA